MIDRLIINSPFREPSCHWSYEHEKKKFKLNEGRRPAGYVIASQSAKTFDNPEIFVPIPLVNQTRPRRWLESRLPETAARSRW